MGWFEKISFVFVIILVGLIVFVFALELKEVYQNYKECEEQLNDESAYYDIVKYGSISKDGKIDNVVNCCVEKVFIEEEQWKSREFCEAKVD